MNDDGLGGVSRSSMSVRSWCW